jgi:hypothetical protein
MPGGVRVDLVSLGRLDVIGGLEQPGPQRDDLVVGGPDVVDEQVEVDLLRGPVGPVRRFVPGRELNGQPRFAVDVDVVPIVLGVDRATQQLGPEGTFGGQVGGVEDDDLPSNFHFVILPRTRGRCPRIRFGCARAGKAAGMRRGGAALCW